MMQQRSTVDSRRRLTNFQNVIVSHLMSAVLRQSVELLSNVKSSPQSVLRNISTSLLGMLSKSITFLDFQLSQGSAATYRS